MNTVAITGTGSYLPEHVMTNFDLEKMVDTSDEWIFTRTGIRERRIARADETASSMGAEAARRALDAAGVTPTDVDLIILATITPDMVFPNSACLVQERIGARNAFCYDIEAACSGFVYAMDIARQYLATGAIRTALVIGAEKLSSVTDWQDRSTCVLFGDGAGAAVLQSRDTGRGIIGTVMKSDGGLADLLCIPGGGSRQPTTPETIQARLHYMKMNGNQVFKHAVRCMSEAAVDVLKKCNLSMKDVKWVIPHQANMRIIQAIADRLECPPDRLCLNLEKVGNISGASVPVALDEGIRSGKIRKGDVLLFVVFGGGFTWGASLVEL